MKEGANVEFLRSRGLSIVPSYQDEGWMQISYLNDGNNNPIQPSNYTNYRIPIINNITF